MRRAERRVRDVEFNPQRYLAGADIELLKRRDQLIDESRRLCEARADRLDRRQVYLSLRDLNRRLLESQPDLREVLASLARRIRLELESNRIADSREFFYALQPRARLEMLADRLHGACRTMLG